MGLRRICILGLLDEILCICLLASFGLFKLLFKSPIPVLIFCLDVVSIIESGILKSSAMITSCLLLPSVCL